MERIDLQSFYSKANSLMRNDEASYKKCRNSKEFL